ncbi:MAG: hypothetical protein IKK15_10130, partial [Akkermansia sp.]|nr:hypothetical protein [Akkermansia sp.]
MNGFRIAILSLMVLVVALLFYFVIAMLPNQQRAFEDYNRTKATNALVTNAETASEVQEDSDSAAALEKLRAE